MTITSSFQHSSLAPNARRAAEIALPIAQAMEFAHRHGILHRDLKPANVLVTKEGQLRIVDFGLAKAVVPGESASGIVGTADYMAPEQARGSVADARAVVMARKAMLYDQMLAKANTATKRVSNLPSRIERPGAGEPQGLDKRSTAFQRLSKSGRVEDAAAVFSTFI